MGRAQTWLLFFFVLPKRAATERVLIILDLVQTAASDGAIWEMLWFECVVMAALPVVVPPEVVPGRVTSPFQSWNRRERGDDRRSG